MFLKDQSAPDNDRITNVQATQKHQFETKFTTMPNPSRLIPVQIPVQQVYNLAFLTILILVILLIIIKTFYC